MFCSTWWKDLIIYHNCCTCLIAPAVLAYHSPVIKMPELIKRNEMKFHATLKKLSDGVHGYSRYEKKHSKSIESYLVRILSFPCPLYMPNVLYLPFSFCCLIHAFDPDWFLPCSDILAYRLWKLQLYVALNWSRGLINTHALTTSGSCKFKACELCRTLWERALKLQAITPWAEEGLATRD